MLTEVESPVACKVASAVVPISTSNLFDSELTHAALKELGQPNLLIYWSDLLITSAIGWSTFTFALATEPSSIVMWICALISAIAFYRGLIFNHELAHHSARVLPGLRIAWEVLIGYPLLLPSVMYVGMHSDHHRTQTYGTQQDPEYQPFAGKRGAIFGFIAHTVFLAPLAMLRFLVIGPIGLLIPPLHRWLERHASSLTFNPQYVRSMTAVQVRELKIAELAIPLMWIAAAVAAMKAGLGIRALLLFVGIFTAIAFVNALRALGAHRYESDGHPRSKFDQVLDSIDTPGHFLTELWAPLGLRYHALHHLFPQVPYHNMGKLHRRLIAAAPHDAPYRQAISESLPHSLKTLMAERES
jgi:fatty acid desaturase